MKKHKILLTIVVAMLAIGSALAITSKQKEPVEPAISEVETPVEGDTEVEGQLSADETTAANGQVEVMGGELSVGSGSNTEGSVAGAEGEGNLDGSVGENIYDMTNYMETLTDSNSGTKVDQEYAFDLEKQKQETPVEGTVGSDIGSGNGSGSVGTGSNGAGNGGTQQTTGNSGNGSGNGGSSTQTQAPSDGKFASKESVEDIEFVEKVTGYNEEFGGFDVTTDLGTQHVILPDGTMIQEELLDILRNHGK